MTAAALCSVVDRCGGCPWLARSSDAERAFKVARLHTLSEQLHAQGVTRGFVDAPSRIGYRNRIRLRVGERGIVGFFNPDKSLDCVVLQPGLQKFVGRLCEWARTHPGALAGVAHLEARTHDADGRSGLYLTLRVGAESASGASEHQGLDTLAHELGPVLVATDRDASVPLQRFGHFRESHLFVPLNGFMQINASVNLLLVEQVVRTSIEWHCRTFVDLYGGAGNFALPLASCGLTGSLIEVNPDCVRAAILSRGDQGVVNLELQAGDALAWARRHLACGAKCDLVIVDPPRAGIREGLEIVSALATRAIVYCSCNLATLERDLRRLLDAGWQLQQLVGFDMFPGTQHQETLAVCVR